VDPPLVGKANYGPFMDAKTEELRAAHDVLADFPSVPRLSEAGLDPETLSLRASMEFIFREFDQRGA
jgi:hypothetical protein